MSLLDMLGVNCWFKMHLCYSFRDSDDCLQLSNCDWDSISFLWNSLIFWVSSVGNVHILEHVTSLFGEFWLNLHLCIAWIFSEEIESDFSFIFFFLMIHVEVENMRCNSFINAFFSDILNDKDWIKSRQNWTLEINLFSGVLQVIVSSEKRICCGKNRGSWVENCSNTSLSDGDSLLLHCLMNSNSILWSHFIKLIDAYNTTVCKDHSSSFKLEITWSWILNNRSS